FKGPAINYPFRMNGHVILICMHIRGWVKPGISIPSGKMSMHVSRMRFSALPTNLQTRHGNLYLVAEGLIYVHNLPEEVEGNVYLSSFDSLLCNVSLAVTFFSNPQASYGIPITPLTLSSNDPNRRATTSTTVSRTSKRYSVTALYSMAAEQDVEVEDDLARAQKRLRELKSRISAQSKKNFVLERDVRYLDSRIALLIQNRMALDEKQEVESHLDDTEAESGSFPDDRKLQQYGNLFFLLQTEPRHIATLCRLVSLTEIDTLLQTVMFTLYGNQYESREEHLLLTMFQSVLSAQFETTPDFNSLLRANTPVSRMMTTYTRRGPGQSYLKLVLSELINSLIEHKDLNLEINPLLVYEQWIKTKEEEGTLTDDIPRSVTEEYAASNETVKSIIAPRITMLMDIANSFLKTIMSSIEQTPYGIRWICKQIRSLTKRKFPDCSDYAICSLIGGFFFLRFINSAIVTPQTYMLVDGLPSKHPRRTLTLVAKILQNLANKPSYKKEEYMKMFDPFVENNKQRINKFLLELCEVGDFYESLEMDQYMALSKKDLILHITLNEVYNTHALLVQHQDVLAPSEKNHLRILLDEVGPAPPQVGRKENKTIELPLFSRWETPIQDLATALMSDNSVTQNDILYMETKSIFVQIIRSIPKLADKRPIDLPRIAEIAATAKDATLVRKGIKVKEMLRELEEVGVIDHKDEYHLMTEEVVQELTHLGNLREKVKEEIRSLEAVYKTICDHNNYLRSQLDSYKAYLQNVRQQTSKDSVGGPGSSVVKVGDKEKKPVKMKVLGPYKFTHTQLERDGVIVESNVPENRRQNIYFNITSPIPGTFIIALHYKGRDAAILEMDLKLDDLLEKQQDNVVSLDLEYVQLNVNKILSLLNKTFAKRKTDSTGAWGKLCLPTCVQYPIN
ncbi:324_t:CDS:10, partial [Acaulospora morrowiae]